MGRLWRVLGLVVLCAGLSGCNLGTLLKPPPDGDAAARAYIEDLRLHHYAAITAHMDGALLTKLGGKAAAATKLATVAAYLPTAAPRRVTTVGWRSYESVRGVTTYMLSYEYEFPGAWRYAVVDLRKGANGALLITGLHVNVLDQSLETANAFTFRGKDLRHDLMFGLAVLFALFTIGTAIACARTPIPRRKWLWVLFVLVGFCTWKMNWTTGAVAFMPLSVVLFGAGFSQAAYGPVLLQIGLPLGAAMFWARRPEWLRRAREAPADLREPVTPPGP